MVASVERRVRVGTWTSTTSRRGHGVDIPRTGCGAAAATTWIIRGAAAATTWIFCGRVAAPPRPRRGYSVETSRRDAARRTYERDRRAPQELFDDDDDLPVRAASTWIFFGDESRRRRDADVRSPSRPVIATPRLLLLRAKRRDPRGVGDVGSFGRGRRREHGVPAAAQRARD